MRLCNITVSKEHKEKVCLLTSVREVSLGHLKCINKDKWKEPGWFLFFHTPSDISQSSVQIQPWAQVIQTRGKEGDL